MTNTVYFNSVVRDDCSSVDESSSESRVSGDKAQTESDLGEDNELRSEVKPTRFSVFGKGCFDFGRSVNLPASADLKGESSGTSNDNAKFQEGEQAERRCFTTVRNQRPNIMPNHVHAELIGAGWPSWLSLAAGEAIMGWVPRRADGFEKLDKIGAGIYSNVYKAREVLTGRIVALKKIRFYNLDPESVKFITREILTLRHLNHPNVVKLEGVIMSRMHCSLYLIFEYMDHDLAGLLANPEIKFTLSQVKCYMHQLLSGLEHCHNRQVLHRDIKVSNLLVNNGGVLKIADFGSASFFETNHKHPMTSHVTTLWYRAPELLLGETFYGTGVDLWSTGCVLAELLAGKPIMTGRTEVEQLHEIFKLCGSPTEKYWKTSNMAHILKPKHPYNRRIAEAFRDFPPSSLPLLETLLAIDPAERQTATAALRGGFFPFKPYACEPSDVPQYPTGKEIDAKLCEEKNRRHQAAAHVGNIGVKKNRQHDDDRREIPAPKASTEPQAKQTYNRQRLIIFKSEDAKCKGVSVPWKDRQMNVGDSSSLLDPALIASGYYHPSVFIKH